MKTTLAALCLCAAPLLAQAQNCGSPNTDAEYILGTAEGEDSAMHWASGLVWKRCSEGQSFSGGRCTGTAATRDWNGWAVTNGWLPRSFAGQSDWGIDAAFSQDLLTGGDWRMAYRNELVSITAGCGNDPKVNRTVFPDTPLYVWSGSPLPGNPGMAWLVNSDDGVAGIGNRSGRNFVRLLRGGQPFAALASPAAQSAAAGAQAAFPAFTLVAGAGGRAWGGARINGAGSPEFQVNGGAWVQEAIVKSGDQVTVRLTAPSAGANTATFSLRSGQTTGTSANGANGGSEATAMRETTASFTISPVAYPITTSATGVGTVACTPNPVAHGQDAACTATPGHGYRFTGWTGDCSGRGACQLGNVTSAHGVGARFVPGADLALAEGPYQGQPLVLDVVPGQGWQLAAAATHAVASVGALPPPGVTLPHGVVSVALHQGTQGSDAEVVLTYPDAMPPGAVYYKYGPTRDDPQPHWYPFGGARIAGNTVTLTLTDGEDGDGDLARNGSITDPGGPALVAAPAGAQAIPTLGEWGVLLLSALLAWAGLCLMRIKSASSP